MHSDSGSEGESYTVQILLSPRPFLNFSLVVDACAMILPPKRSDNTDKFSVRKRDTRVVERTDWLCVVLGETHAIRIGNNLIEKTTQLASLKKRGPHLRECT